MKYVLAILSFIFWLAILILGFISALFLKSMYNRISGSQYKQVSNTDLKDYGVIALSFIVILFVLHFVIKNLKK